MFVLLLSAALALGRESRPDGSEVALVWPAAGVGAWWLMDLRGRRLVLDGALLVLVTVLLTVLTELPTAAALLFGLANLGHGLTARWQVRRLWPDGPHLTTPTDVLRLLRAAGTAGLIGGTLSALSAWALLDRALADALLLFVARNAGTTFVVLALVLALRPPHRRRHLVTAHRAGEFVALVGLTIAFAATALVWQGAVPVGFLIITLPVWAGARLGVPRAGAVSGLVSTVTVGATATGANALADVSSTTHLTALVQVFTVLAVLIALVLATLHRELEEVADRLGDSETRLRRTSESALVGMAVVDLTDPEWVLRDANPALRGVFPGSGDPLTWRALLAPDARAVVAAVLQDLLTGRSRTWSGEVPHRSAAGSVLWAQVHVSVIAKPGGHPALAVVQMLDITARKDAEAHLSHLALHDPLTGLPNRLLLRDRLDHELASAGRNSNRVAVVFLDLDGFKGINDTLGHEVGDLVLATAAARLQGALRPGDTVARLGGDEFVACCSNVHAVDEAHELAGRLMAAMAPPIPARQHLLAIGVSAGVALSRPGDTSASLLRAADEAMYAAKRAGRGRLVAAWEDPPTPARPASPRDGSTPAPHPVPSQRVGPADTGPEAAAPAPREGSPRG